LISSPPIPDPITTQIDPPQSDPITRPVNGNLHAVIIGGDRINDPTGPWDDDECFWNEASGIYCTLLKYGYSRENIVVHYAEGEGPDGNQDLDNSAPVEPNDIDFEADKDLIIATFQDLEAELTPQDMLFIFLNDHGDFRQDNVYLLLPGWDIPENQLWDFELAEYTRNINCSQIIFNIECCYSGGFVDDLNDPNALCQNRVIHTMSGFEPGYGEKWITSPSNALCPKYSDYTLYWTAAARNFYPYIDPQDHQIVEAWNESFETGIFPFMEYSSWSNPAGGIPTHEDYPDYHPDIDDGNNDGFVQMNEIFRYTNNWDTWSDDSAQTYNGMPGYYNPFFDNTMRITETPQQFPEESCFLTSFLTLSGFAGTLSIDDFGATPVISGNYLFSDEFRVKTGVTLTIAEDSQITLIGEAEFIVEEGAELVIERGATFYCGEYSKIKVEEGGSLVAIGTEENSILFTSSDENPWTGIELYNAEDSHFQYCQIENAKTGILLHHSNNSTFTNNEISNCSTGLQVKGDVFDSRTIELNNIHNNFTGIYLYYVGIDNPIEQFNVSLNAITNNDGAGIFVNHCGKELWIGDNSISNNNRDGIKFEYSEDCVLAGSDSEEYLIEENSVGISFFQSVVKVVDQYITNNEHYGLIFLTDGHPGISSNRIVNNGIAELYCNYGHPDMANGHNDVIHSIEGYLGYRYEDGMRSINCSYNWWGSNPPDPEMFFPFSDEYFRYNPADEIANHDFPGAGAGDDSDARIAYNNALEEESNENYSSAVLLYKEVIDSYPTSEEALLSLRRLFICEKKTSRGMLELKLYFENLANSYPEDTVLCLLSRNLTLDYDKENGLYGNVLLQYSDIIDEPIDEADSVFTQINVMNTLLEIEESGRHFINIESFPENIRRLQPKDVQDYQVRSNNLLSNLMGYSNDDPSNSSVPECVVLKGNYPNPFNPTTSISFSIPNESKVDLIVYNIKGQKVKSLINNDLDRGNHSIVWYGVDESGKSVSSGVYFYELSVNGNSKSVKKCLMLK